MLYTTLDLLHLNVEGRVTEQQASHDFRSHDRQFFVGDGMQFMCGWLVGWFCAIG